MTIRMMIKRNTAANWTSKNPVLGAGEMGIETDTRKIKFGDGVAAWNSLGYASSNSVLPDQTGNSGKFLKTNGSAVNWSTVSNTDIVKPMNTLSTSGVISLLTNTYNCITPTDAVSILLPTTPDTTIVNEIELIINQTSVNSITFDGVLWDSVGAPTITIGIWNFVFTYVPGANCWIGSYKKWENS